MPKQTDRTLKAQKKLRGEKQITGASHHWGGSIVLLTNLHRLQFLSARVKVVATAVAAAIFAMTKMQR